MKSSLGHSQITSETKGAPSISLVIGRNVHQLRLRAKINKKKFALMLDIGRPFLDKIESGQADMKLSVLERLASALETTPEYLITNHVDIVRLPPSSNETHDTPQHSRRNHHA